MNTFIQLSKHGIYQNTGSSSKNRVDDNLTSIVISEDALDTAELCRRMEEGLGFFGKKICRFSHEGNDSDYYDDSGNSEPLSSYDRRRLIAKARTNRLIELIERRRQTISSRVMKNIEIVEDELDSKCEKIADLIEDWSCQLEKKRKGKGKGKGKRGSKSPPHIEFYFEQEQARARFRNVTRKERNGRESQSEKKVNNPTARNCHAVRGFKDMVTLMDKTRRRNEREVQQINRELNVTLGQSAQMGWTEQVETLLDAGAEVNSTAYCGFSPLGVAALFGRNETLSVLLKRGADPDLISPCGWTALHCAAARDHPEAIRCLIAAGAALEIRQPSTGETPLHLAAARGREAATHALLAAGARTDVRNFLGGSPQTDAKTEGVRRLLRQHGLCRGDGAGRVFHK